MKWVLTFWRYFQSIALPKWKPSDCLCSKKKKEYQILLHVQPHGLKTELTWRLFQSRSGWSPCPLSKKKGSEEQLQSLDMLLRSLLWVFRSIAGTSTAWKYSLEMQWLPYNNIWITFVNVSSRLRYIDCTLPYQDFQTMLLLKIVTDDTILSLKSKAITAVYIHKTFWYQAAK